MKPQANFNRIARLYRWLEYLMFGRTLQRCRLHYLPRLRQCKQALILGDGDGRFLACLLLQNLDLHADAIDSSASMLHLLRRNCEAATPTAHARLQTHCTNVLAFTLVPSCDLVVSHFFLDCLTQHELDSHIAHIAPALTPQATWLISDFRVPAGPMRLPARIFIRSLYLAFRILTGLRPTRLPDHATPLTRAGFTRISHHYLLAGVLATELWQSPAAK